MSGGRSEFDRLHTEYQEFHDDSEDEAPNVGFSPSKMHPMHHDEGPDGDTILHMVPEGSKSRWSHIEDLDSFFKKVYEYHQRHGFKVMMTQKFCELFQVLFIIFLSVYMMQCVDYQVLFGNKALPGSKIGEKLHPSDVLMDPGECTRNFTVTVWIVLFVAIGLWIWKALAVGYQVFEFWDIKNFYNQALKISDGELDSITWNEVQRKLVVAQADHLMCIHKDHLTELDIYHRILRYQNYMVAMVNKDLLPVRLPYLGIFFSQGLRWNIEFLFFKSPWSPFDKWHLKEDYRKNTKRKDLAANLQKKITMVALVNLCLMPLIMPMQILYKFFSYADMIKREPGFLGVRKWGQYARIYLRHFNEHDHELKARLSRAYRPANQYMDMFMSPMASVLGRFVCFIAGSLLAVMLLLTVWDEDVLSVEHSLTVMTVLGAVVVGARVFIPDPNMVFSPEKSLTACIAHIHYFPGDWKGSAHDPGVMENLNALFPYTAIYLLHELLSPLVTPFVLLFALKPKSQEIVDFFRNFTVDVVGVGDVCSFAQMDVRRHGSSEWQKPKSDRSPMDRQGQAEGGKTEMSLVNFTLTNPDWKPPQESENFITDLKSQVARDAELLPTLTEENAEENALYASLHSLDAAGVYSELANHFANNKSSSSIMSRAGPGTSSVFSNAASQHHTNIVGASMLLAPPPNLRQDLKRLGLEYAAGDMSFSALYLHEVRHRETSVNQTPKRRRAKNEDSLEETEEETLLMGVSSKV